MNFRSAHGTPYHHRGDDMTERTEMDGLPLDPRQSLAHEEWRGLSTAGQTPLQQQFRPDRVARALPAGMLIHVERGGTGLRLRQRLEGRFVTIAFGEGGGRSIEDIYADGFLFEIMPRYLESATTGDAAMTRHTVQTRTEQPFTFTRLILPFAGTDGRINRLFTVFAFDPVALARLSGPLDVLREPGQRQEREPEDAATASDLKAG